MFDDHWRTCCQSQDSTGKRTVKTPYFSRSTIPKKYPKIHIISEDESSQKEEARGATGWAHHQGAQAHPWQRWPMVRPP
jgi:hypothetical protein